MPCVYLPGPAPAVTVANSDDADNGVVDGVGDDADEGVDDFVIVMKMVTLVIDHIPLILHTYGIYE